MSARVQPQRSAWLGDQNAGLAQRAFGGAVKQHGVALGKAGCQTPQHRRRNIELADQRATKNAGR